MIIAEEVLFQRARVIIFYSDYYNQDGKTVGIINKNAAYVYVGSFT